MTAPEEHLAPIRERLAAATPGPWKANEDGTIDGTNYAEVICKGQVDCMSYCYGGSSVIEGDNLKADAEFIAHARQDVPRLLAALDGVLALVDAWKVRGEHLQLFAKQAPEAVREALEDDATDFLHKADLIRNTVTTALEGQG